MAPATEGWVRRWASCIRTFCSVRTGRFRDAVHDRKSPPRRGRICHCSPAFYGGHAIGGGRIQESFHGTAIGVPTDHDVLDFEGADGIFNDGADAAEHFAIRRDHVANVARDENVTWLRVGDGLHVDAGIGTSHDQRMRPLGLGGRALIRLGLFAMNFVAELECAAFSFSRT